MLKSAAVSSPISMLLLGSLASVTLAAAAYVYIRRRSSRPRNVAFGSRLHMDDDLVDPTSFQTAANQAKFLSSASAEAQLLLYGLYKRVTNGVAPESARPALWDLTSKAKYDAWMRQSEKTRQDAADEYVALVQLLSQDKGKGGGGGGTNSGGPRVSMMIQPEGNIDLLDSPYERIKALMVTEDEAALRKAVTIDLVAERDDERRTLLHWAADGNHLVAIRVLVEAGADVDALDDEELTPLTYSVCNGLTEAAKLLVRLGANTETAKEYARGEMRQVLE